ncbi:hypothetical protein [Piscinibacter terrae]|uniref:Signal peptide prediction n=1 Tax=Piscinibacter terrae TaxID=2496871 RepID=A0A3N7HH92_9BURK|nr:hypothetical protein [Albitalea terrae]RQP21407.1 hypothetical protein DZC73_28410 [Albitalea terrae]
MPLLRRIALLVWVAPCSVVGMALVALVLALGGHWRLGSGTLQAALRDGSWIARRSPFHAITLGHVIVAVDEAALVGSLAHELVHVRQYERWGVVFFVAYPLASVWLWMRGRRPYWDNPFEVQARELASTNLEIPVSFEP